MDTCGGVEQNKDFRLGKENSTMSNIILLYQGQDITFSYGNNSPNTSRTRRI